MGSGLMALTDSLIAANPAPPKIADSSTIVENIRNFLGPIVLLVFGALALVFLMRRQVSQFIMFIVIGAAVFLVFYSPEIVRGLSEVIKDWLS